MRPTLNPNKYAEDIVLVVYSKFTNVSRGDVVILVSPKNENTEIIKRVVALEGDVVLPRKGFSAVEVPKGHCWVEGDNTRVSEDSNCFGPVPMDFIVGKATTIVWPPTRWGKISNENPTNRTDLYLKPNEEIAKETGSVL